MEMEVSSTDADILVGALDIENDEQGAITKGSHHEGHVVDSAKDVVLVVGNGLISAHHGGVDAGPLFPEIRLVFTVRGDRTRFGKKDAAIDNKYSSSRSLSACCDMNARSSADAGQLGRSRAGYRWPVNRTDRPTTAPVSTGCSQCVGANGASAAHSLTA
jgi:hypothetical protein